jgi:hypothetical protein
MELPQSWRAGGKLKTLLPASAAVRCPARMTCRAEDRAGGAAYGTEAIILPGRALMLRREGDMGEPAAAIP